MRRVVQITNDVDNTEVHISSFIIYCRPEKFENVKSALMLNPVVEIFGEDLAGKFIVVIEGDSSKRILDVIAVIEAVDGVLNTSMVYHHSCDEASANETEFSIEENSLRLMK